MIKIESRTQLVGIVFSVLFSIALAIVAALKGNQYWSSPFIALLAMFFLGSFPMVGMRSWFQYLYAVLAVTAGVVLLFTPEQIYWTTPLLLGVLANVFNVVPQIDFGNTLKIDLRKSKGDYYDAFAPDPEFDHDELDD